MGIKNLLPELKCATKKTNLNEVKRNIKRLGVDGGYFLHRCCYLAANQLVLNRPTTAHMTSMRKYLTKLISYGFDMIVVFDGEQNEAKLKTNEQRNKDRDQAKEAGIRFLENGDKTEGRKKLHQALKITDAIVEDALNNYYFIS